MMNIASGDYFSNLLNIKLQNQLRLWICLYVRFNKNKPNINLITH